MCHNTDSNTESLEEKLKKLVERELYFMRTMIFLLFLTTSLATATNTQHRVQTTLQSTQSSLLRSYTTQTISDTDDPPAVVLSARESIFCDVCVSKTTHCNRYIPDVRLFDSNRPPPEKSLGALIECKPSEAEYWMTDGAFKLGDGDHDEETRDTCPSPRRRPKYQGKLSKAQQICSLAKKKITGTTTRSCTTDLNAFQSTNADRRTRRDCGKRFFLTLEEDENEDPQDSDAQEIVAGKYVYAFFCFHDTSSHFH